METCCEPVSRVATPTHPCRTCISNDDGSWASVLESCGATKGRVVTSCARVKLNALSCKICTDDFNGRSGTVALAQTILRTTLQRQHYHHGHLLHLASSLFLWVCFVGHLLPLSLSTTHPVVCSTLSFSTRESEERKFMHRLPSERCVR